MGWAKNNATGQVQWIPDAAPRPVIPVSPMQAAQQAAQTQNTGANTGQTIVKTKADLAGLPYVAPKAAAEVQAAQNEANGLTPVIRRTLQDRLTALNQLNPIINDLGKQYEENFRGSRPGFMKHGTGNRWFGAISEAMPETLGIPFTNYSVTTNPLNHRFNETARQAGAQVKSILGLTGTESNSAAEYDQKVMPYLPRAGDDDATIAAKIGRLRQMYQTQLMATQKSLGIAPPPTSPRAAPKQQQSNVIDFNHWGK